MADLNRNNWFDEINLEIRHRGQYRSVNFPYANMMLNQSDESR